MVKKVGTYKILYMLLLLVGFGNPAKAQNNPYKISDSLYPLYEKATQHRREELGLRLADSLYRKAVQLNDKKAQCLALAVPIFYYFNAQVQDEEKMGKAVSDLKILARKNGYLQYYYFAYNHQISFLLNQNKTLAALQASEEMKQQAFADDYGYGIATCLRSMGGIYTIRGDYKLALKCYQESFDYIRKYATEQDLAHSYYLIGTTMISLKQYKEAYEQLEKGRSVAKTTINKFTCMLAKGTALYYLNRWDEFEANFKECDKYAEEYAQSKAHDWLLLNIYHLVIQQDYQQAHELCRRISFRVSHRIQSDIYQKEKNFKEAYRCLEAQYSVQDSLNRRIQDSDFYELNVRIGNEQLKKETQALQLENAQLNLQKTTMALEQAQSQVEIEKMNTRNNQLELQNRDLELAQVKAEAERQHSLMEAKQLQSDHQLLILGFILSFFVLIAATLTYYIYARRKTIGLLKYKNEELTVARDQAEQADKMKTFFIQNMSHEIRTPLNSIVGFSQILSDPEMELDNEEKKEYSQLVQHNSDLLTTLVNDILDLASLESGKYTMEMGTCSCNEMGRMCISTVKHRNPDNVKLYYTSDVADDFMMTTDGKRLQQVLINFLTNAEKYTEKGEIHLHCSLAENPGKVTFSVTDTGSGIPLDKMDTVFERFKKLDEFKQGTGLGLNICRLIAERLHGEVKMDKNYTNGARFLFILPLDCSL